MNKIPGWTTPLELTILKDLASQVPEGGSILEIGAFLGRSTQALYAGKKESVTLDVIDTFEINNAYSPNANFSYIQGNISLLNEAKKIALETGNWLKSFKHCIGDDIFNNINVFHVSSENFEIYKKYDLVFIDGNHSFNSVSHDIKKFSGKNTLIVGDDFIPMFQGVAAAVCLHRNRRSLISLKFTKFYILIPNTNNSWKTIISKYV